MRLAQLTQPSPSNRWRDSRHLRENRIILGPTVLRSLQHCRKNEHHMGSYAQIRLREKSWHRYCLRRGENQLKSYAPRKNLTHEPTVGRVQSTSGQYSILSAAVPDGDTGNRDIIQDGGFQLSRTLRFRGAHCVAVGRWRFVEPICVRVRRRKHLPDGHR